MQSCHFMANRCRNNGNSERLYFGGFKITADSDCRNWKTLASWKKSYDQPRQHIKKQRHYFSNKGPSSQSYGFSSSHVLMWELDYTENSAPKNWFFWTVVLEKTLESPLDSKVKPFNPKWNQSWVFIGKTGAEAEAQYFGHLMGRTDSLDKTLVLGKIEGKEKWVTEDEMVGCLHWLNGYEFGQTSADSEGHEWRVCCRAWGLTGLDTS